jgi:hypothetical protein
MAVDGDLHRAARASREPPHQVRARAAGRDELHGAPVLLDWVVDVYTLKVSGGCPLSF